MGLLCLPCTQATVIRASQGRLVQNYRLNLRVGSCKCWHIQRPPMAVGWKVCPVSQVAAGC